MVLYYKKINIFWGAWCDYLVISYMPTFTDNLFDITQGRTQEFFLGGGAHFEIPKVHKLLGDALLDDGRTLTPSAEPPQDPRLGSHPRHPPR